MTRWIRMASQVALNSVVMWAASLGVSAAPAAMSYTGELRAENGVLYTGNVAVTVGVFGSTSGNDMLWGPQDLGTVAVMNGLFGIVIGGTGAPLGLDDVLAGQDALWLELTIDGVALAPRQRLTSTPYTRVADQAQRLGGVDAAEYVTQAALADFPWTAFAGSEPPAMPQTGELWLNTDTNKVLVWAAGAWQPVSTSGLTPADLPPDGLNEVSNQTLSNEFFNVFAPWEGGPANIIDNVPAGTDADITLAEGSSAILRDIVVSAVVQLTLISDLKIVLQPPAGLNMAPIVLYEGTLLPDPGAGDMTATLVWDASSTLALAGLLGHGPAGTWTLNVSDNQKNVVSPPFVVAHLNAFEILYDVLRSDEVNVQGTLRMQGELDAKGNAAVAGDATIGGTATIGGDAMIHGSLTVTGDISASGSAVLPKVYRGYATTEAGTDVNGVTNRSLAFTKQYANSSLKIEWYDNTRCYGNDVDCGWNIRIDGKDCASPGPIRQHKYNHSSAGGQLNFHHSAFTMGICDQLAGETGPIATGPHTITIETADPSGNGNGDYHAGWNAQGWTLTVQEVLVQ